jgi:hypothetical protein
MTPAEELRKAAAEIQRRGWFRGQLGSDETKPDSCSVCALGALNAVSGRSPFTYSYSVEAADQLREVIGYDQIGDWNDTVPNSADEVVAAMLAAAAQWETEHPDEIPPSKGDGPFLTPLGAI